MRHRKMLLGIWAAVAILVLLAAAGESFAREEKRYLMQYNRQLDVVGKTADVVELRYATAPNPSYNTCQEYRVYVEPSEGLEVLGPTEWNDVTVDKPFDEVLRLKIAKGDTCSLHLCERADCSGMAAGGALVYFISIADSVEVHYGKIRAADQRTPNQRAADEIEAMLSEAHLDYEYDVKLFLRYSPKWEKHRIDRVAGPLKPGDEEGIYYGHTTKRGMLFLLRHGYGFQKLTREYPDIQRMSDSVAALSAPPR